MSAHSDRDYKNSLLLVASFAAFLNPFLSSSVNLALPAIGHDLNTGTVALGWVATSFILTSAIFLLPMGRLADISGRIKIFKTGIFLFTLSSFFIIFCNDITSLIILRILQGLSGAMFFSTSLALISSAFPPGERGKAIGINITSVYLGLSAGPVVGGFFTRHFGWRSIFITLIPLGIISLILIYKKLKTDWADAKNEKFDLKGSLLYGISLALFIYGFSKLSGTTGWILMLCGLITGFLFFFSEKHTTHPVFDFGLFANNRIFTLSSLAALIHYAATAATGFFMSLYLQYIHGLNSNIAGLIMISQPLSMMALSPIAGKLSDKIKPGILASFGMGMTAVGLSSLCFISLHTSLPIIIFILIIMGIGFAFFSSPNSNAIMSSVEKKHFGIASGVVGTMRVIGQSFSMGITMMILTFYIGKQPVSQLQSEGLLHGMKTAFIIFSFLCIPGILASLARNKTKDNKNI